MHAVGWIGNIGIPASHAVVEFPRPKFRSRPVNHVVGQWESTLQRISLAGPGTVAGQCTRLLSQKAPKDPKKCMQSICWVRTEVLASSTRRLLIRRALPWPWKWRWSWCWNVGPQFLNLALYSQHKQSRSFPYVWCCWFIDMIPELYL